MVSLYYTINRHRVGAGCVGVCCAFQCCGLIRGNRARDVGLADLIAPSTARHTLVCLRVEVLPNPPRPESLRSACGGEMRGDETVILREALIRGEGEDLRR